MLSPVFYGSRVARRRRAVDTEYLTEQNQWHNGNAVAGPSQLPQENLSYIFPQTSGGGGKWNIILKKKRLNSDYCSKCQYVRQAGQWTPLTFPCLQALQ